MTQALCLGCGGIKHGAMVPCGACGAPPVGGLLDEAELGALPRDAESVERLMGRFDVDILFTDHHMTLATLGRFGAIVAALREQAGEDREAGLAAFLLFLTERQPELLEAKLAPEMVERAAAVLAAVDPAPVEVEEPAPPGEVASLGCLLVGLVCGGYMAWALYRALVG